MEITSIKYISASPYMSKAQIQKLMNVSARTVTSRIAEIDQYVQNGRYGAHKPYVKYGTEAEKYLRELFKMDYPQYEMFYEENNMWTNDAYPFAHASLDGWLKDEAGRMGVWECKTTNILQSRQKEKWDHRLPENYYIQILHYLMVTEFEFVELKAQLKSVFSDGTVYLQTRHYHIERSDVEADIEYLADEERKFWTCVENMKAPPLVLPEI